jgi:hypothetical protein
MKTKRLAKSDKLIQLLMKLAPELKALLKAKS